jgi:syntaxin 1B/2/3
MNEMTTLVNEVMNKAKSVKDALMQIKEENDQFDAESGNQNSARSQVRNNLYQATCRRFQEHMAEFTDAREAFRQNIQDRMVRQIQIVDPSKDSSEARQLVENGLAEQIITKALASDNLREVVQELRARNQELMNLQRNVESLYEMFKDLYALIEMQGESLNIIEQRVARSLDYVQKGEEALKSAKKHQSKAGKLKCILLIILIVVFIIVMIPILITSKVGKKEGGGEASGGETSGGGASGGETPAA